MNTGCTLERCLILGLDSQHIRDLLYSRWRRRADTDVSRGDFGFDIPPEEQSSPELVLGRRDVLLSM